ncbi:MAG: spore maturation protein [Salibacteraceae bacterium]|nr:spore maturation protein [Salibacteraceae bacterium]
MAFNYIWVSFFVVAFAVALFRVLCYFNHDLLLEMGFSALAKFGNKEVLQEMVQSTFNMAETSVEITIYLMGIMTLWMGIMKVGEEGGAVNVLTRMVSPFFKRLFPGVPANHPAIGSMMMNFSANMLGLDNAATPLGLKAMDQLQTLNEEGKGESASNAMIMFIVLNTSGLTLIPVSVMALRAQAGAANPSDVFLPILLATYFASLGGLIAVSIKQKISLLQPVLLGWLAAITAFVFGMMYLFNNMPQYRVNTISSLFGNGVILTIIILFILMATRKKVNVYNAFIDGAKEGFQVAIKVLPYLVAMLVAIGLLRVSGTLPGITYLLKQFFSAFLTDTRFVDALPTALMKPLSGSGARGMMVDQMQTFGADGFVGRLASIFQGSTETTFYTLAVYFGAVNIKNTRYALGAGLFADLCGIIASIFIAYLFFG